ncbi:unnamed protein product [Ilex paraguariensis]|uniref:Uncharacterized protein n=1 Tax=Ilex paraguariensis TaxID=185542 RepID=A0ABC8V2Z6_9AQUA
MESSPTPSKDKGKDDSEAKVVFNMGVEWMTTILSQIIVRLIILSTSISYTVLGDQKGKLAASEVVSLELYLRVDKAEKEKVTLSLKVSKLTTTLAKKDAKLTEVLKENDFELSKALKEKDSELTDMEKTAKNDVMKEYKYSFEFKKETL